MKDIKKGILHLLIVLAAIGALAFISFVGIGKENKGSAKNIRLGLDLAGGVSITYQTVKENPTATEMSDTVYKLRKRVDAFSTEADVYQEGSNRINIDIPNVQDPNEVLEAMGKAGSLEFLDPNGEVVIDGSDVDTAVATQQADSVGNAENVVKLTLKPSGRKKFAKATAEFLGQSISIVYDGETISSPTVQAEITDGVAIISGSFKEFSDAESLATTIRIGALPLELKEIRSNVVGAKLGLEAINTSLLAGVIGLILVILFMIVFYRVPGVAAAVALILYVGMMLVALNGLDVTLTLPGVAGIILSVGMAVDANVIIFTRIKEELASGKTVRSSIKLGFDKALSAIIDGNVTTLIAAAVLYFRGTGTVKGFAQTLAMGIILSMFTALTITKFLLNAFYHLGADDAKYYGIQKPVKVRNFTGNVVKFYAISGLLFAICIGGLVYNKVGPMGAILNYSLDFMGGTSTELTFPEDVVVDDAKMQEVVDLFKEVTGATAEVSDIKGINAITVRTTVLDKDQRMAIEEKLISDLNVERDSVQMESISATVSGEMRKDAIIAVVIAIICMLVYIWFRFKDFRFGASAVLALAHDVIVVLAVYAVFSRWITVGGTFIACMLTIVGYSINATIIVFDRIRENLKAMRNKDTVADVVNLSTSQTISRNINTSLTTFITVFVLAVLGVDSIRQFAIPLMVGIVCGAYSSICITGTLWYQLKRIFAKK